MSWLLTGGAGYIGSHIILAFQQANTDVVVLDNLATGFRGYVPDGVPFVEGSVTDPSAVARAMDEHAVDGVMHLAGLKYAGQSVSQPLAFFRENVTGMQVLMQAVHDREIEKVVLSSSASWYGTPDDEIVDEDAPPRPESPYGQSKVISEWLLRDVAVIQPSLRHTALRYFNVVGSGPVALADHSPFNLFPKVFRALSDGQRPVVNGTDYPTPDGSCVRDYVHVVDLAEAHVVAASHLDSGGSLAPAYNVGRGTGSSVLEVLNTMRRVTGVDVEPDERPRRPGDPARVVGGVERIASDLDWHASRGLDDMVESAWAAWQYQLTTHGGTPADGGRVHADLNA
jgi:UDP-glucose 4-epimerase